MALANIVLAQSSLLLLILLRLFIDNACNKSKFYYFEKKEFNSSNKSREKIHLQFKSISNKLRPAERLTPSSQSASSQLLRETSREKSEEEPPPVVGVSRAIQLVDDETEGANGSDYLFALASCRLKLPASCWLLGRGGCFSGRL